jgi:predicted nucleic acid-binding protein
VILVDSSVWIDHIRRPEARLLRLISEDRVLGHPLVSIEILLGSIATRQAVAAALDDLPLPLLARVGEIRALVDRHPLHGRGIGYADAALLAACRLTPGTRLWTRDKRLHALAVELDVADPGLH